jgi:uncharacterized protein YndB with AHSA1/START domain
MMQATYKLDRGYRLTRTFDAPPDMVFEAWTDPAHLTWFFNPGMPTSEPVSVDLRVGGQWRQLMVINSQEQYFTGGVYREIVPGQKLVFSWGAKGGWPDIDLDKLDDGPLVTLVFTPKGEKTEMAFHLQFPDHFPEQTLQDWMASGMRDGWGMTIDRLVARFEREGAGAGLSRTA